MTIYRDRESILLTKTFTLLINLYFLSCLSSLFQDVFQVDGFTPTSVSVSTRNQRFNLPKSKSFIQLRSRQKLKVINLFPIQYEQTNFYKNNHLRLDSSLSQSAVDDDNNAKQISYKWTKPTFAIALPALIGAMTDPLLSLIDTGFVGQLPNSSVPLAALGACTSIFHLALNAFRATTTATTSLVSEALNKEKQDGELQDESKNAALEVTVASIQFGLIAGFSILTILLTCSSPILSLMGISSSSTNGLFVPAKSYLTIRTLAAPFVLFGTVAEGVFRGYANTVIPLIASTIAAGVNLVLDPLLMFGGTQTIVGTTVTSGKGNIMKRMSTTMKQLIEKYGAGYGISGAAGATAFSQMCAGFVYAYMLWKKQMIPSFFRSKKTTTTPVHIIWKSILKANFTMMLKQGSLLLAWAYATSRATKIGTAHVAAHQVALSLWLIFALVQDGAAVAAQVLMSQTLFSSSLSDTDTMMTNKRLGFQLNPKQTSLVKYMLKLAFFQSCIATTILYLLGNKAPGIFTNDMAVQNHLTKLMPILAFQQPLISMTLVTEGLAVGGNQFGILASGTALSTIVSMKVLSKATSIQSIWKRGIICLFAGRFLTALYGVAVTLTKGRHVQPSQSNTLE